MKKTLAILLLVLAFLMLEGCTAAATDLAAPSEPATAATEPPAAVIAEPPATETQVPIISREEAFAIALDHAGFAADLVSGLECEVDTERWGLEYEVDFHQGKYEYNYDIHAETGEILYWEKEIDD